MNIGEEQTPYIFEPIETPDAPVEEPVPAETPEPEPVAVPEPV